MAKSGLFGLGFAAAGLHAQPTDGTVVSGHATIETAANLTTITADNNSVLRWGSFDVPANETVRFVQPGSEARVLNWIGGLTPSQIDGSLLANGHVYLVNPQGVYFGQSAVIDAGRLYAIGGSLSKEDFLNGIDRFTGLTGEVGNAGSIRGEMVALIGRSVANSGSIVSSGGFIGLASGDQVLLGQDGSSIFVDAGKSVTADTAPASGTGVANSGTIDAGRGTAVLAAGDFYSIAITHDGKLAGRDIRIQGQGTGDVLVSGTIDASATGARETGGRVEITGERVGLFNTARVDASGPAGGGTILVGGDFQGKNSDIRNAARTYIGKDATLTADAISDGHGGKIIVWADDVTRFFGSISARGGAQGGNGGFVEVSGKHNLAYNGQVYLTAGLGGIGGTLLLDPDTINIENNDTGGADTEVTGDGTINFADGGTGTFTISDEALEGFTGGSITLQANLAINVNQALVLDNITGGETFTLQTGGTGTINFGGTNVSTDGGAITLIAGTGGITALGGINTNGGLLTINTAGAANQNGGDEIVGSGGLTKLGAGTLTLSEANTYTGLTTVSAGTLAYGDSDVIGAGAVTVDGATAVLALGNNQSDTVGTVTVANGGSITGTGTSTLTTTGTFEMHDGAVSAILAGAVALNKTTGGTVTLSGANTYTGLTTISAGTLAYGAGDVIATGAVTVDGGTAVLDLGNDQSDTVGTVILDNGGSITGTGTSSLTTTGTFELKSGSVGAILAGAAAVNKTTGSTVTLNATNTNTGTTTVSAGTLSLGHATNTLDDTSALVVSGGTLDLGTNADTVASVQQTGGTIQNGTLTSTAAFDMQAGAASAVLAGTAGLTKTTAGTATLSGANTYTGVTTISAGILSVTTINNGGAAGGLGQETAAAANLVLDGGTLQYTGALASTDRLFTLTNSGGTIDASGSGALSLTNTGNVAFTGTNARTFALTGTNTGANTLAAVVGDNTGATSLTKSGAGTWTLSSTNTYTGTTTVSAGTLTLGHATNTLDNASDLVVSGGVLDLGGNADTVDTVQQTGGTIQNGTLTSVNTFDMQAGTASAVLAGAVGLTKTTTGTTTLSGANTYTGVTTINAGTLVVGANAPSGMAGALGNATSAVLLGDTAGSANAALLTGGAFSVDRNITVQAGSNGTATIGGSTAAISTFSGAITLNKDASLTAVNGGTATFSNTNTITDGAGSFILTLAGAAGSTLNLNGVVTVNSLSVLATSQALSLTGATSTIDNAVNFANTGILTLANALTFSGGLTASGPVALGADTDLTALTATFNGTVTGTADSLDITGNAVFGGAVTGLTTLDVSLTTAINTSTVTTSGTQTYTGAVTIGADTTLTTTNSAVNFDSTINSATARDLTVSTGSGVITLTGAVGAINPLDVVTLTSTAAITLPTVAAGSLVVTAGGPITQSGDFTISGLGNFKTLNNGGAAITLANDGNAFGSVGAQVRNAADSTDANADISLHETGGTVVAGMRTGGNASLVTNNGALTQTGSMLVTGTTTVTAGTNSIALIDTGNDFTGAVSLSNSGANNVAVTDTNAIILGTVAVGTGTLAVTANAGGAPDTSGITQSGAITQGGGAGTASFAAGAGAITLNGTTNNFTGSVALSNTGTNDVTVRDDTGGLQLGQANVGRDLTVQSTGGNISLEATKTLVVPGVLRLIAGANHITLDEDNTLNRVVIQSGNNVTIKSISGLLFGDNSGTASGISTVSGNLSVTSSGNAVGQTEALLVTGTTGIAAGANAINLTNIANNFTGAVSLSNSGLNNVAVTDSGAIDLGTVSVGTGTLTVNAVGITQSGIITQAASAGAATFNGGAAAITLTDASNDFTGAVSLNNSGAFDVAVRDVNALDLGTSSIGRHLSVTAGGHITQTGGALTVTGGTTTVAVTSAGSDILLHTQANDFGTSPVVFGGTQSNIHDVGLRNINAGAVQPSYAGLTNLHSLTLIHDNTAIDLPAFTLSGDLTVTAGGMITDSGVLSVTGTTTLAAGSNDIILDSANNFGTVAITSGNNVTLVDTSGLILGTSTIAGTLSVTTAGDITDSGNVAVTGLTTLTTGAGNSITLDNADNFSTVVITNSNNVTLNDTNALDLGTSTITGNLAVTAGGAITDSGNVAVIGTGSFNAGANAITLGDTTTANFGAMTVVGTTVTVTEASSTEFTGASSATSLTLTSGGAITQTGGSSVVVSGTTSLNAAGANVTLAQAGNNFGTVTVAAVNDVTLRDLNAIDLGASTINGFLDVTAGGAITDSGTLTVTGTTTLAAGGSNNITLDNSDDFSTVIITSGNNVTLNDTNALDLGASTISGALNVTTAGEITDSGALAVTGATTLVAGAGNNITLDDTNNFNSVAITSGNNVILNDTNGLILGTSTVSGTLDVTTAGTITDSGALTVAGTTTLAAGAGNNITLDNADNFSTVIVTSGNNVTLVDTNALDLGASAISGALNVTTAGAITDSGALTVTGATTLVAGAGNNITLDDTNDFSSVAITSGNNVTLNDTSALDLGASTVSGTLDVTTAGAITDIGNISVAGTTTLAAGSGNDITLNNADNFSTVAITSGNNVTLNDTGALDLGASTISGTLVVTTAGAITDSGNVSVAGTTTLTAGAGNNITLDNSDDFSTVAITSGNNVTLNDTSALDLGTSTVSGTLTVTTAGAITDSGALAVTGLTTLAAGAGNNITLNNANNFSTVAITSGNNVTLNDTNALILGTSTVSGTLDVTTAGTITDSGNVTVAGTTTLAAGAGNNITLDNADNFSTVTITSGNNVTLVDTSALDLGASTVSGTLNLTAGGHITQSGALTVTGGTTVAVTTALSDILLGTQANNLGTVAPVFAGTTANIRDVSLRNTNAGAAVPTFTGLTNLRNLTLLYDNTPIVLPTLTASGNLTVTAGGAITDSGVLTVAGTTTLTAGAGNNITLDNADNFGTVAITSGNNVVLNDTNALDLGASTISGTLTVTTAGAITDSGAVTVAGTTTLTAGAGNNITLDNADNFSAVTITSGNNVTLNDTTALVLGASTVSGTLNVTTAGAITQSGVLAVTGAATLAAGAGNNITLGSANSFSTVGIGSGNNVILNDINALDLGASTISGTLTVTTAGAITDSGNVAVAGATTLTAGAGNNITLDNADDFSTVTIVSGNNVTLVDTSALDVGASTVSGTLNVTTAGALTDSGVLTVTGTTTLAAGAGNNITFDNVDNFSTVVITSGNNVTLNDTNALVLGASTVSGNLTVTTAGTITDSGVLTVGGATTLTAGAANNITLDNANNFNSVGITSGNNVILNDTSALDLGTSTVSGTLTVTTAGAITDSGNVSVVGLTTLTAGAANNITLNNADNFSTVVITSGNNVTLNDTNALVLGASTISGTLNVTTAGTITQSGVLAVTGAATLSAGSGNNITLNGANSFSSVGVTSGNNVILNDTTGAFDLGASTISGTLDVTTVGAITDSGAVTVAGTTTLVAGAGNNITLDNAGNFSTVIVTSANNLTLVDTDALNLGTSTLSGTLTLTAGSHITQSGVLTVPGQTTLAVTGAGSDILLGTQLNDLGTLAPVFTGTTANVRDVSLHNIHAGAAESTFTGLTNLRNLTLIYENAPINLSGLSASGTMNLTAGGAITDSGAVTVAGTTTLAAGAGNNITFDNADNFSTVVITSGNNVTLNDTSALDLGASTVSGTLTVTTAGAITDSGAVTAAGTTTLTAGAGNNITFDNADNFSTVIVTSANNLTLVDTNALNLGSSTLSGALTLTTGSHITQSGVLTVPGLMTLAVTGAGSDILLGTQPNDLGTLAPVFAGTTANVRDVSLRNLNPGAAMSVYTGLTNLRNLTITYDNAAIVLPAIAAAGFLNVTAGGTITDAPGIGLSAGGLATFNAGTNPITLGDDPADTTNFGSLTFTGGTVTITEDSATDLTGINTAAGALTLTATGSISDAPGTTLNVTGVTTLNAGGNAITLGDDPADTTNFGRVVFTGGAVDLTEDSSMIAQGTASVGLILHGVGVDLAGISTPLLGVYSTGPLGITDSVATNVIGSAVFDANGYDIILDETLNDYDTIQLAGATVAINDVNALGIAGALASGPFTAIATTRMNVNTTLNGADTISLTVLAGDLTVSAPISVATGNILLTAGQNVVTTASGPLAALSPTGAIIINAAANAQIANLVSAGGKITVNAAGSARFTDPLQLAGLFTVNASAVTFDSTLNGNGASDLLVNTAGTTRFNAPIGATSPLHTLTTNVGGTTEIAGGAITTSGAQSYNDPVQLAANAILTGVGNTFARTVNGPFALTVTDSGTTTFAEAVGTTSALASLTTTAGGITAINGGAIVTTGAQIYGDAVELGNTATLTAATLTFNNTLNSASNGLPLLGETDATGLTRGATVLSDLVANVAGVTRFNSPVGKINLLGAVTTDAAGSTEIMADFYATKATFNDGVTLGDIGTAAFTLDTTGTQTFAKTVLLNTDLTFHSAAESATEGITFQQGLTGGGHKLALVARRGAILAVGNIGTEDARFSTVSVDSRNLVIGADVWSEGDITLSIGTANPDPGFNDFLSFNVPPATAGAVVPPHHTRIDSATGEIRLGSGATDGTTAKTGSPFHASLFKSNEGDLYLFARKITIQPFERLAVRQGSLIAIADGPAVGDGITLSDTTVSNYLVLASNAPLAATGQQASAFLLRSRAGASVDSGGQKVSDIGTYIIAGAVLFYSGNFTEKPMPTRATFVPGTGAGQFDYTKITGNIRGSFGPLVLRVLPGPTVEQTKVFVADLLTENRFRFNAPSLVLQDLSTATGFAGFKDGFIGEEVFDTAPPAGAALRALIVQGATLRSPVENIFAPNVPREDIAATPPEADLADAVREQLQALGIYARAPTPAEKLARDRLEALYVAVPERTRPVESDYEVVDARVEDRAVREVIRLAFETGLLGESQAKLEAVAHSLAESYKVYYESPTGGEKEPKVAAVEYHAWLKANHGADSTKVLDYVQALGATFERIKLLGLTTQELEGSKAQIYGSVLRARLNIEPEFLRALVETASTGEVRNAKRKPADHPQVQAEISPEASMTGQAGY